MIRLQDVIHRIKITGNGIEVKLDSFTIAEDPRLSAFGYTIEQLNLLMLPMVSYMQCGRCRLNTVILFDYILTQYLHIILK